VVGAKLLLNLLEKVNGGLGIVSTIKFGADTENHLLKISSSHLSAKLTPQMEKRLMAFGQDENHEIGSSPGRAFRLYIVIVVPQAAPGECILADGNHPRIGLKGVVDRLGLIHGAEVSVSISLALVVFGT